MITSLERLAERIRNLPEEWKKAKYAASAFELIKYFTQVEFREYFFESFEISGGAPSELRLIWLAASLFILRDESNFPELLKRIKERDLRSTYFEISAAGFCRGLGFSLIPSPGIARRGKDFDFTICIEPLFLVGPFSVGETINVEVTELQSSGFDIERVVGSLNKKRRQLPSDLPNVIFCQYPFAWTDVKHDGLDIFDEVTSKFFRGTRRINCVIFSREVWSDFSETYVVHNIAYINRRTRHKSERLNIALQSRLSFMHRSFHDAVESKNTNTDRINIFKKWVDSVLS